MFALPFTLLLFAAEEVRKTVVRQLGEAPGPRRLLRSGAALPGHGSFELIQLRASSSEEKAATGKGSTPESW